MHRVAKQLVRRSAAAHACRVTRTKGGIVMWLTHQLLKACRGGVPQPQLVLDVAVFVLFRQPLAGLIPPLMLGPPPRRLGIDFRMVVAFKRTCFTSCTLVTGGPCRHTSGCASCCCMSEASLPPVTRRKRLQMGAALKASMVQHGMHRCGLCCSSALLTSWPHPAKSRHSTQAMIV